MRALIAAGLLLLGGGMSAEAVLANVAAAPNHASDFEAEVAHGAFLIEAGRFNEAIALFGELLALRPDHGPALAHRALAYAWTNRVDEATRDVDAAARAMGDAPLIHRVRGVIAQRRSDEAAAIAAFSRSLDQEPGNPLALRMRAYMHQRAGNHVAALADADAYIAARPEDPSGYVLKADLLIGERERASAQSQAELLMSLFPADPEALASAARIFHRLAQRDRALTAISQAAAANPDSYNYRLLRARFRRWDDFAGRRADLKAALRLDPGNGDVFTELGLLDFRQGRWADAIARFSAVLDLEPRDFGLLAYRAMAYLNAGDGARAEQDFHTAAAAASGADDLNLICHVLAREGIALDKAMELCDRAVELDSNDSAYRANRGLVELRLGQLDAALADYDVAVEADGRRAEGYYGRALVHLRRGDRDAADADRREALAIDPGIEETYREYGLRDF